jgi:hypothetical protein
MALTHQIVETRQYLNGWLSIVNIVDTATSKIYHRRFNTPTQLTSGELDALVEAAKVLIQAEIDFDANDMNLSADEERAVEYLRNIKRDIVVQIRAAPAVTLAQAQTYIDNNYPNSIVNFDKLYAFYLNQLNLSTWAEFKTFVINHKFREVD